MSEITLLNFYEQYVIIDGKKPIINDITKWLLENLENRNIQRVWTRKHGYQYKTIKPRQ